MPERIFVRPAEGARVPFNPAALGISEFFDPNGQWIEPRGNWTLYITRRIACGDLIVCDPPVAPRRARYTEPTAKSGPGQPAEPTESAASTVTPKRPYTRPAITSAGDDKPAPGDKSVTTNKPASGDKPFQNDT